MNVRNSMIKQSGPASLSVIIWGEISVKITQGCSCSIRVYHIYLGMVFSFDLGTHFFY